MKSIEKSTMYDGENELYLYLARTHQGTPPLKHGFLFSSDQIFRESTNIQKSKSISRIEHLL